MSVCSFYMLIHISAKNCVNKLKTSANTKNRFSRFKICFAKSDFIFVSCFININGSVYFLSVILWMCVASSAKKKSVIACVDFRKIFCICNSSQIINCINIILNIYFRCK